jgi:hypothetical protein
MISWVYFLLQHFSEDQNFLKHYLDFWSPDQTWVYQIFQEINIKTKTILMWWQTKDIADSSDISFL